MLKRNIFKCLIKPDSLLGLHSNMWGKLLQRQVQPVRTNI